MLISCYPSRCLLVIMVKLFKTTVLPCIFLPGILTPYGFSFHRSGPPPLWVQVLLWDFLNPVYLFSLLGCFFHPRPFVRKSSENKKSPRPLAGTLHGRPFPWLFLTYIRLNFFGRSPQVLNPHTSQTPHFHKCNDLGTKNFVNLLFQDQ